MNKAIGVDTLVDSMYKWEISIYKLLNIGELLENDMHCALEKNKTPWDTPPI